MRKWFEKLRRGVGVLLLKLAVTCAFTGVLVAALLVRAYSVRAQSFDLRDVGRIPERSAVYDTNRRIYSYLQGENRLLIPLSRVPKDFINALLAREDARFYQHSGVDFLGILRACLANFRGGTVRQGASTLTQQLARNSFGLTARTVDRKLVEAMLALRIERNFSKDQILECYINRVYFGAGVYGLQRAAQVYFGKSAEQLTLSECAMLAGLIRSPNRMSPLTNLQGAMTQRDEVLKRMLKLRMTTRPAASAAKAERMKITGVRRLPSQKSYTMDAVRRDLDLILSQDQIDQGGLRIFTTLDPVLQRAAEQAVERRTEQIELQPGWEHPSKAEFTVALAAMRGAVNLDEISTPYLQAALIAVDNRSGAIRAMVGGRDYEESKFDRAILARRQAGSTFKPFVYATAFQHGLLPGTPVGDWRIRPGEYRDLPPQWSPGNSDGEYGGRMPASYGLIHSRNTMSVRVGEYAGLQAVRRTARLAGLDDVPPYPVVFLGGFETTLKDLVTAYTAFPNRGKRVQSYLISRIENARGRIIFQVSHAHVQLLGRDTAWLTSELLRKVLKVGTGAKAGELGLTKPAAGKTGTTNGYRDAWFVGYTSSLTCGVWVGFDRPKTIMEKGYGATLALPIWVDLIQAADDARYPALPFAAPEQIVTVRICSVSGGRATPGCNRAQTSYPIDLPATLVPPGRCTLHDSLVPILAGVPATEPSAPIPPPVKKAAPTMRAAVSPPSPKWTLCITGANTTPVVAPGVGPVIQATPEALPGGMTVAASPPRMLRRTISAGRPTGVLTR